MHYAGEVSYQITNFIEKNKDTLHIDIKGVMKHSSDPYIASLFADPPAPAPEADAPAPRGRVRAASSSKKNKSPTLGQQFTAQLTQLMEKLNTTEPHFVRCIPHFAVACLTLLVACLYLWLLSDAFTGHLHCVDRGLVQIDRLNLSSDTGGKESHLRELVKMKQLQGQTQGDI